MTVLAEDIGTIREKQKTANVGTQIAEAARKSGRSPFAIAMDFWKLRKQRGKVTLTEYLLYGLYDPKTVAPEERSRFISALRHWPISKKCNNADWWAVTENKWLSSVYLRQNHVATPATRAIFDRAPQLYPDTEKLQSAEDLAAFLKGCDSFPLFAKPVAGMWSAGALRISGISDSHVMLDGREPVSFEYLADTMIGDQPYIFQTCLTPHSFFDGITDAIATVRFLNLIGKDGLTVPFSVLKLPMKGNVADNFWRQGNVLCNLDPNTGEVLTIVSVKDGQRIELDALPDSTRKFLGENLPLWQQARELNEKVALLHTANRYGSTDIALTEEGPQVIEVNTGCAFELVQMATGKGFLTDGMEAFFKDCGAEI